jgi:hypothetical protein
MVNAAAYVVVSVTGLMAPQLLPALVKVSAPALLGEPVFALWLLIAGARAETAQGSRSA